MVCFVCYMEGWKRQRSLGVELLPFYARFWKQETDFRSQSISDKAESRRKLINETLMDKNISSFFFFTGFSGTIKGRGFCFLFFVFFCHYKYLKIFFLLFIVC